MDNRRVFLAVMAGWACTLPEKATAFVVEDLVVQESPTKPFHAEIRLRMSADEQIKTVKMGSSDDFKIMRLTRAKTLDSIAVDTVSVDAQEARISLTSDTPILQKNLDFVLQISSNKQTQFPVFHLKPEKLLNSAKNSPESAPKPAPSKQETPSAVAPPAVTPSAVAPKVLVPESPQVETVEVAQSPLAVTASRQQYGPIKEGDNLTTIARRLRTDKGVSLFQIMTALFERNSNQFLLGNMNSLISGGMLLVPSFEEIRTIPDRQARIFCMEHTKVWEQMLAGKKVPPPAQVSFLPPLSAAAVAAVSAPVSADAIPTSPAMSALQSLTPPQTFSPAPQVVSGLEKMLGQLQGQLGELTQVIKTSQTQQVKLDSRVSTLEAAQSANEALVSRVSALEKAVLERPKENAGSLSLQESGRQIFGWVAIGLVVGGLLFLLGMVWLGLRWNRKVQWNNLQQFLAKAAKEHPFLVQNALKQTEPQFDNDFVPSIHMGKMDGVPLQTGKKVVSKDLLQNVNRLNAIEQEREETR